MTGILSAEATTRSYWARGRGVSACWLTISIGVAVTMLTRPGAHGAAPWVPAGLLVAIALVHGWRLVHPAGTRLHADHVQVRSWTSPWRAVRPDDVRYVDISRGHEDSTLVLHDGTRVRLPGLPVEAAEVLALAGSSAATQVSSGRR